jgi:hypothetical protein
MKNPGISSGELWLLTEVGTIESFHIITPGPAKSRYLKAVPRVAELTPRLLSTMNRRQEEREKREWESVRGETVGRREKGTSAQPTGETSEAGEETSEKAEKWDGDFDAETFYEFNGETYVHGMMDREALREKFYKQIPNRRFELR